MDDRNRKRINLPGQPVKYEDRRKKADWVVRSVTIVAAIGWVLALFALLLVDRASPIGDNFITRFLDITVVSYWNTSLLRVAFAMTLASLVVCVAGVILNAARHRRKTDRYNKLLISITVASSVLFALYLIFFARYL